MNPNNVQLVLDTPFYSRRSLTTKAKTRFFDQPGVSATDNIDIANQLDKNSEMTINYMQFRFSTTAKTPIAIANLNMIALIQQECWLTANKNTSEKVWQTSMGSLFQFPSIFADAASAYNLGNIVNAIVKLNVPLILEGGENINFNVERETTTDYSAIQLEWILWGSIDRRKTVE